MNAPVKKIILIPNPRKEISPEKICSIISRLHHAGCDIGYYAEDGPSLPEFTHAVDDAGFSEADAAALRRAEENINTFHQGSGSAAGGRRSWTSS